MKSPYYRAILNDLLRQQFAGRLAPWGAAWQMIKDLSDHDALTLCGDEGLRVAFVANWGLGVAAHTLVAAIVRGPGSSGGNPPSIYVAWLREWVEARPRPAADTLSGVQPVVDGAPVEWADAIFSDQQ